jgi:integrase
VAENKLTDKHLRNLKSTELEQVVGDGGGLWLRVLPTGKGGAINFYYRFLYEGKERRYNCGTYPETTLAQARQRRNDARNLVKSGVDPVLKEQSDRITRASEQAVAKMEKTVADLLTDWKRVYLSAHRSDSGESVEAAMLRDVIPVIGTMKAKGVKLQHIIQVIDRILERGARRTANMALSNMRQMFRHGLGRGIVETDPTLGISRNQAGGKETPVDRNLSFDELKELRKKLAASDLPSRYQAAIWFLLATGARIGELLKARWDDINTKGKVWTIPAENSKNGREHLIHLSAFAAKQLGVLKQFSDAPYLLSGRDPKEALSDKAVSRAIRDRIRTGPTKRRIPKTGTLLLSGGEWSPHDLRRTMASRMGDIEIEPHVIERCLNHVQQGIVGVYQRQEYLDQRKAAFEKWGKKLSTITKAKC